MNFWQFLDRQISRVIRYLPGWPDGRGLVGVATFTLTCAVLYVYHTDQTLRDDDFFKTVATAIVITGFVNAIVGWAFGDTARSAKSTENTGKFADAMTEMARTGRDDDKPLKTEIVNPPTTPVDAPDGDKS